MKLKLSFLLCGSTIAFLLAGLALTTGCTEGGEKRDSVTFAVDSLAVTSQFKKSNGELCRQQVNIKINYPKRYRDAKSLQRLQALYAKLLLDAPDSLAASLPAAMSGLARALTMSDAATEQDITAIEEWDVVDVDSLTVNVLVTPVFNSHDIVSLCKQEIMMKNGRETSRIHRYFNIDLEAMARVEVNRLFKDVCVEDVCKLLRAQLLKQNHVAQEEQLNELGYYNLPNISVTDNFYFTPEGLVWSYEPGTLAVATVGEPTIALPYGDLAPYLLDNSILKRF